MGRRREARGRDRAVAQTFPSAVKEASNSKAVGHERTGGFAFVPRPCRVLGRHRWASNRRSFVPGWHRAPGPTTASIAPARSPRNRFFGTNLCVVCIPDHTHGVAGDVRSEKAIQKSGNTGALGEIRTPDPQILSHAQSLDYQCYWGLLT
jgi:hypothetical protein